MARILLDPLAELVAARILQAPSEASDAGRIPLALWAGSEWAGATDLGCCGSKHSIRVRSNMGQNVNLEHAARMAFLRH